MLKFVRVNNVVINLDNIICIDLNEENNENVITMIDEVEIYLTNEEWEKVYKAVKFYNESNIGGKL